MTTNLAHARPPAEPAAPARSVAVVVLGAGRSGTSALTRGVQALGVDLGDKLRPPGGKNPTGFFEDQDLLALNKRLKRALGIRGDSLRLLDADDWNRPAVQALQREAVACARARFGAAPLWGFKYGRTLRLLPFWEGVFAQLAMEVRYVVALRNPLSVARSRAQLNPERGRQAWSDLEWLVNVVPYFDRVRGHPLAVVDFDALLADPAAQLERAAGALRLPLAPAQRQAIQAYAQAFLRPGLRHSQFQPAELEDNPRVNRLVCAAYRWLHGLAHGHVTAHDPALWQDWERIRTRVVELAPMLAELDHLRHRLDRALWNPASPWQALRQTWRDLRSR